MSFGSGYSATIKIQSNLIANWLLRNWDLLASSKPAIQMDALEIEGDVIAFNGETSNSSFPSKLKDVASELVMMIFGCDYWGDIQGKKDIKEFIDELDKQSKEFEKSIQCLQWRSCVEDSGIILDYFSEREGELFGASRCNALSFDRSIGQKNIKIQQEVEVYGVNGPETYAMDDLELQ